VERLKLLLLLEDSFANIGILIGLGLLLALLFTIGGAILSFLRFSTKTVIEPVSYLRVQFRPTSYEVILLNNFPFYRNLSQNEKMRFVGRLKKFIKRKEFIGRQDLVVTEEMKALVSASAIQLTFGLEEYLLSHFEKIFLYPDVYYSKYDKKYHMGEVNLGGVIAISWKSFQEGYKNPSDNYNVGLHEMAHALRFANICKDEFDHFFANYFDKWAFVGLEEFARIKAGKPSMIRKYAGTNVNEFFAVCAEYFFESPKEFKEKLPEIYKHMCILLNQDPLENNTYGFSSTRQKILAATDSIINENEIAFQSGTNFTPLLPAILLSALIIFTKLANGGIDMDLKNDPPVFSIFWVSIFLLSGFRHIKRIAIYKNALIIHYPFLKMNYPFLFENIVSATFHKVSFDQFDPDGRVYASILIKSSLTIVYIQDNDISSKKITINMNDASVKRIISLLKSQKVFTKVYGEEWVEKQALT
jgi:Mlc titration factor MtfA (ptsG expression regulator)